MTAPIAARPRRCLLYMPGDSRRKIEKAVTLGVDCICMDLEDGVALSQKDAARTAVLAALRQLDFRGREKLVRLNPFGSGLEAEDLAATIDGHPDGLVLPKVHDAAALRWLDEALSAAEAARGWTPGSVGVIAIVESAWGVLNLREICAATPRLQALVFGGEDLAADLGAVRTPEAWEVFHARSAVVLHAAAFGLQAIDMVFVDYRDTDHLAAEAAFGATLGYSGKQAIHPNQVGPIQSAFTPGPQAVAQARRIVEAYTAHQASGVGAFALDGKMVDAPIVKAAQRLLARALTDGGRQTTDD
jgi:citrate lyase beta subunit